jgi:AcrR family transcriptional regulator
MKPSPARHHASKHDAVFRAAKTVFIQRGFDGASMDEVAALAGTTKATVYAHAGSKADLFRLVVREAVELSAEKIEPVDRALPPQQSLCKFLARFVEISCWQGSVGLQRTVMIEERVIAAAIETLAAYLEETGCARPPETAAALLEAATGQRRFATLLGTRPALPLPPAPGIIQPGAMDEAISFAVERFLGNSTP